jgi:2-polyprenyl-3-methyl-5-hydroxy-6-metoxy-1,4-benzoquinol methylase
MPRRDAIDPSAFDREFFDRFYRKPATRASGPEDFRRVSRFLLAYLDYLEIEVRTVLDLGCGLGRWKDALEAHDSRIRYTGVDISPWACQTYGWHRASVEEFRSDRRYDLVICQDVLPYLPKPRLARAIDNIATLCRGAAYLQVVTDEDWTRDVCDPKRTDMSMYRHSAAWYRRRIGRHFFNCGGGLFLPRDGETVLWELERSGE